MYKYIKILEDYNLLNKLIMNGIIATDIKRHKQVYEVYLEEKKKGIKAMQVITNTSERMEISERSVYMIVKKMKG